MLGVMEKRVHRRIVGCAAIVLFGCIAPGLTMGAESQVDVSLRVDLRAETAVVTNNGSETLTLRGWTLVSVTGGQRFTFPDVTLAEGQSVTVTSGSDARHDPPRFIRWTRRNVWNNDGDPGELYDAGGALVARTRG